MRRRFFRALLVYQHVVNIHFGNANGQLAVSTFIECEHLPKDCHRIGERRITLKYCSLHAAAAFGKKRSNKQAKNPTFSAKQRTQLTVQLKPGKTKLIKRVNIFEL